MEEPAEGSTADSNELGQALESVADEMGLGEDGSLGQMDDSDEEPAFGNDTFSDEFGEGHEGPEEAPDLAEDATVGPEAEDGRAHIVNLEIVWGRIRPNDREPLGLQWDPVLEVNEGNAVRVRRAIRFERGDRVLPQTVRNRVAIQSFTRPHIDGVVVQVAVREDAAEGAFLRFRSLPVSIEIPARRLPDLNEYTVIDGAGTGVMMVAVEPPIEAPCPSGFLAGRWLQTRDNGGVFGGEWSSQDGRLQGHLAGRYGVDPDGRRVLHGKVIDLEGHFLGFLAGSYGDGQFQGERYARDGRVAGRFHGHYTAGDEGEAGHFRGAWTQICDRPDGGEGSCGLSDVDEAGDATACGPSDGPADGPDDRPDAEGSDAGDAPAGDEAGGV